MSEEYAAGQVLEASDGDEIFDITTSRIYNFPEVIFLWMKE